MTPSSSKKMHFMFHVSRVTNPRAWLKALICALLLFAGSTAPRAACEGEWVSFPALKKFNGNDVELEALMFRPTGNGPFPALVLMHGCGGM
jgi:poly(3-hydroxybutyrate) depolymerase